ncbi:hypothetical protein WN943_005732 [Citrus x changshan-huyou]
MATCSAYLLPLLIPVSFTSSASIISIDHLQRFRFRMLGWANCVWEEDDNDDDDEDVVVDDVDIEALEKKNVGCVSCSISLELITKHGDIVGRASMQSQISFGSSVKKNYNELKTLDPQLHVLIYKCNEDKSELWARDGNQFHHNHLKGLKWLPFVTGEALSPFDVGWEIGDRWD